MATAVLENWGLGNIPEFNQEISQVKQEIFWVKKGELKRSDSKGEKYLALSENVDRLTILVENDWINLPEEIKDSLKKLAYTVAESKPSVATSIRVAFTTFIAHRQGWYEALQALVVSIDKLVDTIMSSIEREILVQAYDAFDTLDEDYPEGVAVNLSESEDVGDWLRSVSSKALDEI